MPFNVTNPEQLIPQVTPEKEPFVGFTQEKARIAVDRLDIQKQQQELIDVAKKHAEERPRTAADVSVQPTLQPGPPPIVKTGTEFGIVDQLKMSGLSFGRYLSRVLPDAGYLNLILPDTVGVKTPDIVAEEIAKQKEVKRLTESISANARRVSWREHMLEIIPREVNKNDKPPTMQSLLSRLDITDLSSEDVQWAATILEKSIKAKQFRNQPQLTNERRDDIIAQVGRERSASVYGVLQGGNRDLLSAMIELSQPKLPEGTSTSEMRALLGDAGFNNEEIEAELAILDSDLNSLWESLIKNDARLAVMQSSLADIELDQLERMITDEMVREVISRPLAALLLPVNYYIDNFARGLAGAWVKYSYAQDDLPRRVPGLNRLITQEPGKRGQGSIYQDLSRLLRPSRQQLVDFNRIYEQALADDDFNKLQALSYAFDNYDENGWKKFAIEVLTDPISYFGFGLFAKILMPIPKVGPILAGIELGFIKGTDLAFLGAKRGIYHVTPKPLSTVVMNHTKASFGIIKAAVETFSAQRSGVQRLFKDIPLDEVKIALRESVAVSKESPSTLNEFTAAGRILRTRPPVTGEQGSMIARRLGVDSLDAAQMLQIDDILGQVMGLEGRLLNIDEAADLMLDVVRAPVDAPVIGPKLPKTAEEIAELEARNARLEALGLEPETHIYPDAEPPRGVATPEETLSALEEDVGLLADDITDEEKAARAAAEERSFIRATGVDDPTVTRGGFRIEETTDYAGYESARRSREHLGQAPVDDLEIYGREFQVSTQEGEPLAVIGVKSTSESRVSEVYIGPDIDAGVEMDELIGRFTPKDIIEIAGRLMDELGADTLKGWRLNKGPEQVITRDQVESILRRTEAAPAPARAAGSEIADFRYLDYEARTIITEIIDEVDNQALKLIDDATSVKSIHSKMFEIIRSNTDAAFRSNSVPTKVQQAALGGPVTQISARFTSIWANHLDKISRGAARLYLMFAFYSPFNVMENAFKTIYAGLNPTYGGSQSKELVFRTTGLAGRSPIFEEAAGTTLELGALPIADTLRAAKGKLPGMSDNAYRRATKKRLNAWQMFWKSYEELMLNKGARIGLQQQANYLNRGTTRALWQQAPDTMQGIDQVIQATQSGLSSLDKQTVKQVVKEAELRASTLPESLLHLGDDFTPGNVRHAEVLKLTAQYPDIPPEVVNDLLAKSEAGQLFPKLTENIADYKEVIAQKVLHGPELGRQRLNNLVDELMQKPPTTQAELDSHIQTLQFITETTGDLIHVQLKAVDEYTQDIMNRAVKVRIHEDMWSEVLEPFIRDADARVNQYVDMLKNSLSTGRRRTIDELIAIGGGIVEPTGPQGEFLRTTETLKQSIRSEEGLARNLRAAESKAQRVFNDLDDFSSEEIEFLEDITGSSISDLTNQEIVTSVRSELSITEKTLASLKDELVEKTALDAEVKAGAIQKGIDIAGLETGPVDSAARQGYEELLNRHLNHFGLLREARLQQGLLTKELVGELKLLESSIRAAGDRPITTHPQIIEFWEKFHTSRSTLWDKFLRPMAESSAEVLESQARTGNIPLGTIQGAGSGELTLTHVSQLFGSVPADISRGLYIPEMGVFKDKLLWTEHVYARAKTVISRDPNVAAALPDDLGFTKQAIGKVYDDIILGMKQSPDVTRVAEPMLLQLDTLHRELISLGHRGKSIITPAQRTRVKDFGKSIHDKLQVTNPEIFDDSWRAQRQQAFDTAGRQFELDFPDYTSSTAVNGVARAIFPFWTYETHRLFWLARSFVRTPGMQSTLAKYQNYTDNGYVKSPIGGWEVNFLRGSIWMGGMRRLIQRDYPDFYDRTPGLASAFDQMSRFGFYPNIFVSSGFAAFGSATGQSQLGEILPPIIQAPLEAYVAARPDSASSQMMLEMLMPNRFRDYQVSQAVGKLGGPGLDILTKINSQTNLTAKDKEWWAKGQREVSKFNLVNMQMGLMRFRPEERVAFERNSRRVLAECTGIPEAMQEQAGRVGLRISEFVSVPADCRKLVREIEGYDQFRGTSGYLRESELGRTLAIYRQFWAEVEQESNIVGQSQLDLDNQWLTGLRDRDWWTMETRKLNSRIHQVIQDKRGDPRFIAEVNGEDIVIPLTLDERKEWSATMGYDPILMDAEDELVAMYFQVELEDKYDPEIGQMLPDWDRFFMHRQMIADAVTDNRRESFESRVHAKESKLERTRRQDYQTYIRPYQNTFDIVLSQESEENQTLIRRAMATDDIDERREILDTTNDAGSKIVSQFQSKLSEFRSRLRELDPEMDGRLALWTGRQPVSNKGLEVWRRLRMEYGFTSGDITSN